MSKPLKKSATELLAGIIPQRPQPLPPALVEPAVPAPAAPPPRANVTKLRTKQMTLYLDEPVYRQLREIAFTEDSKMHPLILEALDMFFKSRNRPSRDELMSR